MRWSNVWLILGREVRDQLRDRRTLFMILGLPILLYPILGTGAASLATAFEQKPRKVIVVGPENLPEAPALLNASRDGFAIALFDPPTPEEAGRLRVETVPADSRWKDPKFREAALRDGVADAVVLVPADTRDRVAKDAAARLPIGYNSADEQSQTCSVRVRAVLAEWKDQIVQGRLERDQKESSYVEPVKVERQDVARSEEISGNIWARLFPFLLVMMSLTGAYYPAIDLCAGEKERGTMETLLISPASRVEIVLGKFFTVVLASVVTALLNLLSMGLTGWQLARQFGGLEAPGSSGTRAEAVFGAPNLEAAIWMLVLLVPLSVFFAAISVALAILARSMKEGQYYMTPLYLVAMPLTFLTLAPGVELTPFTSLVPVTGVALLLRVLMQGKYALAARYMLPVLVPTVLYGVFALRWAVDQFRSESVLFREAERFSVADYLRHLIRDRGPRPSPTMAIFCFLLMILAAFVVSPLLAKSPTGLVAGQWIIILGPPSVMAFFLTSDPLGTLRMRRCRGVEIALAVLLAVAVHPLVAELRPVVEGLFPTPEIVKPALAQLQKSLGNLGPLLAILVLGVVPAVCEEVAFRGFILSGLERGRKVVGAVVLSSILFGMLHVLLSLFQQLFNATLLGLILGLMAVKTRSLWPCIAFHAMNNALAVLMGTMLADPGWSGVARRFYRMGSGATEPSGRMLLPWVILGSVVSLILVVELLRRPRRGAGGDVETAS